MFSVPLIVYVKNGILFLRACVRVRARARARVCACVFLSNINQWYEI